MPTTFNVFSLGRTPLIDTVEGNTVSENAAALVGTTFGGTGIELFYDIVEFSPGTVGASDGDPSVYGTDNITANDTFSINSGSPDTFSAAAVYSATLTYADGTTATITATIFQDTTGGTYLAPSVNNDADMANLEAKAIRSLTLDSVIDNDTDMIADRQAGNFAQPNGTVDGTSGDDTIATGYVDGDGDTVDGADGVDDIIDAGDGNDSVSAGAGNDTVFGGIGNDTIDGGIGNDSIDGGDGDDSIEGGDGDDTIDTGAGSDLVYGGAGSDTITTIGRNQTIFGGDGDDSINFLLFSSGPENVAFGGAGNDTIGGGNGVQNIFGGAGNDTLYGGADASTFDSDILDGGDGDDLIVSAASGAPASPASQANGDIMTGGAGNDTLIGGAADDEIYGGADNDTIEGGLGADIIEGGDGNDSIDGGDGDDIIDSGLGDDLVYGGAGNDTIATRGTDYTVFGGDGDDEITASYTFGSNNAVFGEDGNDTVTGANGNQNLFGGAGNDTIFGGVETSTFDVDTLDGGDGDDVIVSGATGAALDETWQQNGDVMTGGAGNDTLIGGAADDEIFGGADNDYVEGGDGDDILRGDDGDDSLFGGDGDDSIDAGAGNDQIFADGRDIIIENAGLEATDHPADNSFSAGAPGWAFSGVGGDWNPGTSHFADEASEGTNTGYINSGSATNTLAETYDSTQIYTLSLDLGTRASYNTPPDYTVTIFAGTTAVATVSGTVSTPGVFDTIVLSTAATGNPALDGQALSIEVTIDGGTQLNFDDVAMVAEAADGSTSGDDTIDGGIGDDLIIGGLGNDSILGGAGDDTIEGADGADSIDGGTGNDTLTGGTGEDTFSFERAGGADIVTDFSLADSDGDGQYDDQLDVSALRDLDGNPVNTGDVTVTDDGFGNALLTFPEGETIILQGITPAQMSSASQQNAAGIPCFTAGTMIQTPYGEVPVEALRAGDLVLTRDNGPQPLVWSGKRHLSQRDLVANPDLRPVVFMPGAFGQDQKLLVSPQHGMLVTPQIGGDEVLARAIHLARRAGGKIRVAHGVKSVTYVHLLFEQHQVIVSNGLPSESFYPGPWGLKALDCKALREVAQLFPEVARVGAQIGYSPTARSFAKFRDLPQVLGGSTKLNQLSCCYSNC